MLRINIAFCKDKKNIVKNLALVGFFLIFIHNFKQPAFRITNLVFF